MRMSQTQFYRARRVSNFQWLFAKDAMKQTHQHLIRFMIYLDINYICMYEETK